MPQAFAHDLGRNAGLNQPDSVGMASIVELERPQAGLEDRTASRERHLAKCTEESRRRDHDCDRDPTTAEGDNDEIDRLPNI